MSNYRVANTSAQWFQDNYPGSDMHLSAETEVVVLHTTESISWPGYEGGATAPNYTAMPRIALRRMEWRAHFPDEKSSRALRNLSGGVETNTLNAVQVELVGTCDPAKAVRWGDKIAGEDYIYWPDAPVWALYQLAKFLADQHRRHGLKLVAPNFLAYPDSYGPSSVRFGFDKWRGFAGICGHQHVPENSHGDPGNIDIDRVLSMTKAIIDPPTLRVASTNLRHDAAGWRGRIGALANLDADVIFTQEAYGLHSAIREEMGDTHHIFEGEGGSKGHREVQVLVRKNIKILDHGIFQATKALPDPGGVAGDRWVVWAKVVWRGRKFLLIGWHGNAAIQNRTTWLPMLNLPRVIEYRKEMKLLEAFARRWQAEGFDPVIGGDGNYRQVAGVPLWFYSPERMFKRLGLSYVRRGLDKIAYPPDVDLSDFFTVSAPGADHPWLVLDLEKPR